MYIHKTKFKYNVKLFIVYILIITVYGVRDIVCIIEECVFSLQFPIVIAFLRKRSLVSRVYSELDILMCACQ